MKKTLKLLPVAIILLLGSCSNKIEPNGAAPQKIDVKLSIQGDYVQPVLKSSSSDITAIQIHQRVNNTSVYKAYAYGLWDTTTDIKMNLVQGYLYRIQATIVEDGKNTLHSADGVYRQPFSVSGSLDKSKITNSFDYNTVNYFTYIMQGAANVTEGESSTMYLRPLLNRYYGELIDLSVEDGQPISINAKRIGFALKYEITGFTEGEIKIEFDNAPVITLKPSTYQSLQTVMCFKGSANNTPDWTADGYSETMRYKITWIKNSNTSVVVSEKSGTFVRKTLYNMVIDLTQSGSSGNVNIGKEDGGFDEGGDIS